MTWQPATRRLNYALILLLVSLLAYSSIGLCITVTPVQADTLASGDEDAPSMQSRGVDLIDTSTSAHLTP